MKKVLLATSALVAFGGAASAEIAFSGYARFGVQYTQGTDAVAGVAAVQGVHTAATAAAVGGATAAGDAVTAEDMGALLNDAALADTALSDAIDAAYLAEGTFADAAEAADAAAAAALAQDADAIAALAALAADVAADAGVEAAADDAAAATALVTAASGTAAVDPIAAVADALNIDQRFNVDINGSMESEGGLKFGAKVRMRAEESGDNGTVMTMNGARYFVSAGGMELAVGNIYGAIDSMSGLYAGSVGLTGLGWANVVSNFGSQTYSSRGAGVNGVELIYSVGDLSLHMSTVKDANTEVAVGYAMNGVNVAVGFSNSDTATDAEWVATIGTKVGGVGVGLAAAQSVAGNTSMTLSGSFAAGAATSVNVYIANDEAQAEQTAYGIGVVHQLGGGASVRGGFANTHGTNRADLGVQFNF